MKTENLFKHGKKITKAKQNKVRPTLQHLFIQDGYITFTDSHRLVKCKNNFGLQDGYFNPTSIEYSNENEVGKYPNISVLFPEDPQVKIKFGENEIKDMIALLKALKTNGINIVSITNYDNQLQLEKGKHMNTQLDFTYSFTSIFNNGTIERVALSTDYLLDCMEFLKDRINAGVENEYYIELFSQFKPIVISDQQETLQYLLLPIRER